MQNNYNTASVQKNLPIINIMIPQSIRINPSSSLYWVWKIYLIDNPYMSGWQKLWSRRKQSDIPCYLKIQPLLSTASTGFEKEILIQVLLLYSLTYLFTYCRVPSQVSQQRSIGNINNYRYLRFRNKMQIRNWFLHKRGGSAGKANGTLLTAIQHSFMLIAHKFCLISLVPPKLSKAKTIDAK